MKKKKNNILDTLYLPEKNIDINIDMQNYKLYEIIFWFSFIDDGLNQLLDPETNEQNFMELSMNLYKDPDLDPIITFINEKKLELSRLNIENQNLSFKKQQQIKQMLRGILLSKIRKDGVNLKDLNNFVKNINSKIRQKEEISEEEYYFTFMISDKYSKNLKIVMPIFEPLDVFYLFYKYDKNKFYKLGDIFNEVNPNLGGINDIAQTILARNDYKNMIELSNEISKLFYENICIQKYNNEENLPMKIFLKNESDKQQSNYKKEFLLKIVSCLDFIDDLEKIYNNQKENMDNYEFKLDDFYKLLSDKNKLMNCSSIFKKEKELELSEKGDSAFSPSFIFFMNNNQNFINQLFTNINNSDKSIIYDIQKKRKINYLPFWLYILRNISSLNCLDYGKKDIDKRISNKIIDKIKNKISNCLENKKPLGLQWLNLVLENISAEILDPNIHIFYIFFNSLINNLNISGKSINKFTIDELIKYFSEIIDFLFDKKLNKILETNLKENNDDNIILKFTKDPSSYLYDKIKTNINNKFMEIVEREEIYKLTLDFKNNIMHLSSNFENQIKKVNNLLFQKEYQILLDNNDNEVNKIFQNICEINSKNITLIDKIRNKKGLEYTNKQITGRDIIQLRDFKLKLEVYKNHGLEINDMQKIICWELNFDFEKINDKEYHLLFKDKIVELPKEELKGIIYIIFDENNQEFKDNFKLEIKELENQEEIGNEDDERIEKDKNLKKDEEKVKLKDKEKAEYGEKIEIDKKIEEVEKDEEKEKMENDGKNISREKIEYREKEKIRGDDKDKEEEKIKGEEKDKARKKMENEEKDKIGEKIEGVENVEEKKKIGEDKEEKLKEKIEYKPENFIKFSEAKKFEFSKYDIDNDEYMKKSIEEEIGTPSKEDVKNPPEVLLSGHKAPYFFDKVKSLQISVNKLLELFEDIKTNKIKDSSIIKNFEDKIVNIKKQIEKIKNLIKLDKNDFDDLNNASRDFDEEITNYYSKLCKYYDKYNEIVKNFLNEFFEINKCNIFNFDFSLPKIPKNTSESFINLFKMKKDSENLCLPIINVDSEGKNLICCYKKLELDLGKTCPAFYEKPYIVNIISFVNEDLKIKLKSYKEIKIELNNKKGDKKENDEQKKDEIKNEEEQEEEKNKKLIEELKNMEIIKYGIEEESSNKLLSIKEYIKKGENIELYIQIPQTFEEETFKISSIIEMESISMKKLELETNIILTTIPISCFISCKEYKLIKHKLNCDNNITFDQCFKLDVTEFLGAEEINFEIINHKTNEPIEFYLSAKSMENNTSNKPSFNYNIKQKNQFKINIPKYDFSTKDNEIPRLNCIIEVYINKNFVIYIMIDALIRPNLNIVKMYDYFTKRFIENECTIFLNESSQKIFKRENGAIKLNFVIYSTMENTSFKVVPENFSGGNISTYEGKIINGKCNFELLLNFDENSIIRNRSYSNIHFNGVKNTNFKINFLYPSTEVFSDDYYSHFGIKGKKSLYDDWFDINKETQKFGYYVTPFNFSKNEIDMKNIQGNQKISEVIFIDVSQYGNIRKSKNYSQNYKEHFYNIEKFTSFSFIYKDIWYPLIKNKKTLNNYPQVYFEDWKQIKEQFWDNNLRIQFLSKIKNIKNAYINIYCLKEFLWPEKPDSFYIECEKIYRQNVIILLEDFRDKITNYYYYNDGGDLTFEILCYYILTQTKNIFYSLHNSFPDSIKKVLADDFNYYRNYSSKDDKNLAIYNYILKLNKIFQQKEEEFNKNNKKIILNIPGMEEIQKNLLINYYSINNANFLEQKPRILINYERQIKNFKSLKKEEETSQKFLIIGNESSPVDINEKQKIDEDIKDLLNLKLDNSININLPEIQLQDYNRNITLSGYSELYNKCIISSRILPAYLQTAIVSENEENSKKAKNYFEILFALYKNRKENDRSLIFEKTNEFVSSFEDMIIKLKDAGIDFSNNNDLKFIDKNVKYSNSFIKIPEKLEPIKQKDVWENKKLTEQNIEIEREKIFNKKIEMNNIRSDNLRNFEANMNLTKIKSLSENSSFISEKSGSAQITKMDMEGKDLNLDDILNEFNKDDDIELYDFDHEDDKKVKEKKIEFTSSKKGKENPFSKTTKEGFENLEKKFNEDYALKYIVDKMKHKVNKNDLVFKYELIKSEIKGYNPEKINLYSNIDSQMKENEKLQISDILENSRFLTSSIIAKVSHINFNEGTDEIIFNKIEANIIIDLARTISNENRYFNMLMVCGLATALFYLKIPYTLSIIGDSDMKVRIKSLDEPHSELILQKLYDCCFIKRNVTQLPTCLKYFIDNYPAKDININRVYYIFTNGFDDELKKCKAWQSKIFNDHKNSFAFIFAKSQVLEKPTNIEYKKYLEEIWNDFAEESKNSNSYVTITKVSFKNLDKLEDLSENLSLVLLRKKDITNKDNSPKFNSVFNIDKLSVLNEKYINFLRSLISDQLDKPEFNDIYIKKNKMPFVYDNQKDNPNQFKLFCQKTGKMIRYDKLDLKLHQKIMILIREFKEKKERLKLNLMNIIFKPNLPTQEILVEEGTHLDITELIKYSINKTPNPRLYREVRDGFVKNYGVSIILDTSISCFNELSIIHTIQTLRILLSAISYDSIPCLDIILTRQKEPVILASEKSGNEILAERSPFWPVLFSCLEGEISSDLASGIKAAYNLNRARRADYTSYIFVLTDGLYSLSQRDRIIGVINSCYSKNINIFGIGVGIYPIGIEKLFPQIIYCQNPYKLIEGISLFFSDISKYKDNKMKSFIMMPNIEKIFKNCSEISEHIKNPKFKHLKDELSKIKVTLESFPFFNPELQKDKNGPNPEGQNSGMYEKDFYEGQKILFAMFFSSDLLTQGGKATTEDEKKINPKYVNSKIGDEECIASVLEYYGYEVIVVTNYEEAIKELCKQDKDKKCYYNSLWVISGQEVPDLPSNNGDCDAPYYVEQFVDCAIQFWKNGGSLVLMGENDPHNFQVNLFLRKLVFPGDKKIYFKIGGNHPGRKILKEDDSGKLEKKQSFNSKIQEVNKIERKSIANNLVQIFEGATVAYVIPEVDISPFIPFSRDSDGGINSLFYNGEDRGDGTGEGDIFIDCAYTKFFLNMQESGTSRYLQNIGGFIGSAERRFKTGEHPKYYRPDAVFYDLKKDQKFYYKYPIKSFDVVYLVDGTGSMGNSIEAVKDYCIEIANTLKKKMALYNFKFGAVFYRDPIDSEGDINEHFDLTDDTTELKNFVSKQKPYGGNDTPEDWVGGYELALDKMSWRDGNRLIIHIADAGAHGTDYTSKDKYPLEGAKLDKLIQKSASENITIVAFKIGKGPKKSFSRSQRLYNKFGNKNYHIQEFDQKKKDTGYFTNLVVGAIIKVT